MKLLILTQRVNKNDSVLGFFHCWLEEFAKKFEYIIVICLEQGEYRLPGNVKILTLGKEKGANKIKYIYRFFKYIWQERENYESVFVHMNQEYVILGGFLWRILGKKISLWYAHGHVSLSLKVAEKITHIIFTSTISGCRLRSKKIRVIGQGIDVHHFNIQDGKLRDKEEFYISSIGRISPSKNYETLIRAIELCKIDNLRVNIVGGPATNKDKEYFLSIKQLVREKGLEKIIKFTDAVANKDIVDYLHNSDLFVNMGLTGSLDKAILEAMACGLIVLTCNEALFEVLGNYKNQLIYKKGDVNQLAEKIKYFYQMSVEGRKKIGMDLRKIVVNNHSLDNFVNKILNNF